MKHFFVRCSLILTILAVCHPALAADRLTVLLDWFVNPNHGPLIVAQEIGAYQRAGLVAQLAQDRVDHFDVGTMTVDKDDAIEAVVDQAASNII